MTLTLKGKDFVVVIYTQEKRVVGVADDRDQGTRTRSGAQGEEGGGRFRLCTVAPPQAWSQQDGVAGAGGRWRVRTACRLGFAPRAVAPFPRGRRDQPCTTPHTANSAPCHLQARRAVARHDPRVTG